MDCRIKSGNENSKVVTISLTYVPVYVTRASPRSSTGVSRDDPEAERGRHFSGAGGAPGGAPPSVSPSAAGEIRRGDAAPEAQVGGDTGLRGADCAQRLPALHSRRFGSEFVRRFAKLGRLSVARTTAAVTAIPARNHDAWRSSSSIETPSGARMKQTRRPGRTVVGSLVNSTPLALRSAAMASMPLTARPKWSRPR